MCMLACMCLGVCLPLANLECFCCFSLAGCSDWLALGKGDIMFSPEPTCIPHPPSAAATIVKKRKKSTSECQREVCAFRRSHTLLFLLKCFSSPRRRLMRYDITALCFIFKRWAGSPPLPLNEAEVPTEYIRRVCTRVDTLSISFSLHASNVRFRLTLANTRFTHNPWRFLSWSHVSDLIGYRINNTASARLQTPHPNGQTRRRLDWSSLSVRFLHRRCLRLIFGFVFTSASRCWSAEPDGFLYRNYCPITNCTVRVTGFVFNISL